MLLGISWWVYIAVSALFAAVVAMGARIVRPFERGLVETFGKYSHTTEPGLRFIVPLVQTMTKVDMRERVIDVPPQSVITEDNVGVTVDAVIYYRVLDPVKVMYNVEDFNLAVTKLAQTNLRNQIGDLNLDETLTSREQINVDLGRILDEATDMWGVKVSRVEIQRIDPPVDITEAMSKQMKAEREKRAVILEAEGFKQSEITRAEGEKSAKILEAEGDAESIRQVAEAHKYEKIAIAQGEAEAIAKVFSSIHEGKPNKELITLKYLETLGEISNGQATKIFMPVETAGVIGGLATMLEGVRGDSDAELTSNGRPE